MGARLRADVEWLLGKLTLARGAYAEASQWGALAGRHAAEAWLSAQMARVALLQREIGQLLQPA